MAFTLTKSQGTVFGNQRVWQGVISADAATGVVSFGFSKLYHVISGPKSAATAAYKMKINQLAAGTSSAGNLAITGVASGDDLYVTVFGA